MGNTQESGYRPCKCMRVRAAESIIPRMLRISLQDRKVLQRFATFAIPAPHRDLSISRERIGDVLMAQGDTAGPLREYRAAHAIDAPMTVQNPGNVERKRNFVASISRLASFQQQVEDGK